ncbi:polysaccharide biosynthesis tyrosine autokinase [Thalassotalea sp. HSM 43]|uniref:GumC family protein n=1 Tax=Thalassotalea sp. HSM 43 TaxID=2552945 RepID=UPI001080E40E|nr:polysaccharide biosynthesis tyrosine autokinase [Thalassotalea sp. HSM 43]QBY03148.1 polysaccharide biosynthesis tyrosine autokinase [Thalassotalea sp. HSM 43]
MKSVQQQSIHSNQGNHSHQNDDEHFDDIDFKQLFNVLLRNKWQIIALTVAVGLFAGIYAYSITPIYQATATMHLESAQAKVDDLNDVYSDTSASEEYYYTQLEIIRSKPVAKKVVENLNLDKSPLFQIDKAKLLELSPELLTLSEAKLDEHIKQIRYASALGYVQSGLSASPIKQTQLINISFTSQHPEMTPLIANAVSQAYIDNHIQVSLERIEKSATWLNSSLSGLKTKLTTSQEALQAFREQESLVDIGGIKSLAAKEVEKLSAQLLDARQALKTTELVYSLVRQQTSVDELASLPDVLNHPAIKAATEQKRSAETTLETLSLTYGQKHPKIIAAKADVAREQANINKNIQSLEKTIGNDFKKSQQNVAQLQNALQEAKRQYQKLTRLDNQHRDLLQEVETNKELYAAFFNRLKETAELEGFEANVGRIIEEATTPYSPIKPNKKLIIVIAMITAAAAAVGIVLLLEAMNSTIRSVDDVEAKLSKSLLGIVPLIKDKDDSAQFDVSYFNEGNDHSFSESIRTLRTSLLLLNLEDNSKVFSVTSTIPGEGKTAVSTNLAFALAQLDKTLLIDTDMRRPSLAKNFDMDMNTPGLSNVIAKTHALDECIHRDEKSGLDLLPAGQLPPNPQELLASNQFKQMLNELKEKYDRIIIDTAPVQAVSDAMIVARLADSHLYVVKAESTKESMIKRGMKRMTMAGINIDGVVLNQVDLAKARQYQDFTGYYDQYGYAT